MQSINVAIGIPSPDTINPTFALDNLPAIISHAKSRGINVFLKYQQGVRTDRNRNIILKKFLEYEAINPMFFDYILWLDADMIYPEDIISKYLDQAPFDIMGCLYFKKAPPYEPVGYVRGSIPGKYKAIDPRKIEGKIAEIDALGFGGMMVNMRVHRTLVGQGKWIRYSDDFYMVDGSGITHDILFCREAQETGYKIMIHSDVKPGHIGEHIATESDWLRVHNERILAGEVDDFELKRVGAPIIHENPLAPKNTLAPVSVPSKEVLVIMPTIDEEMAKKAAEVLRYRAGAPCDVIIAMDHERKGFIKTFNQTYLENPGYKYYMYVAQDAYAGRNWLLYALKEMDGKHKGMFIFNDGKWNGSLPSFGLMSKQFIDKVDYRDINGNLVPFCPEYKSHYVDTELGQIAKQMGVLYYDPESVVIEVDFKMKRDVNLDDKALYSKRAEGGFDGRVSDIKLLKEFR